MSFLRLNWFEFTLLSSNRMRCFYHELTKLKQLAAPFRHIAIWNEHAIWKFILFELTFILYYYTPIESKKKISLSNGIMEFFCSVESQI